MPTDTATDSTHDLECSHSERSIDEAIERSSGTLSPLSPIPMAIGKCIPKQQIRKGEGWEKMI